jgi:hypothetical protein
VIAAETIVRMFLFYDPFVEFADARIKSLAHRLALRIAFLL